MLYIVRTEKSSFYLPSLILSFFFQTRKKKNANLFISNYVYLKFSVFWQNKHHVKYKYWLLILKQFTCVSLYSIALSRD